MNDPDNKTDGDMTAVADGRASERACAANVLFALGVAFIVAVFSYLDLCGSLLIWTLVFVTGATGIRLFFGGVARVRQFAAAYVLVSCFGAMILFDAKWNWDSFYYAKDDVNFFARIQVICGDTDDMLDSAERIPPGPYEYLYAPLYWTLKNLCLRDPIMPDLLVFNWLAAALTIVMAHRLAEEALKRALPFGYSLLCLGLNMYFIHSSAPFFRDGYVALFSVVAIYLVARRQVVRSLVFLAATTALRGGSGAMVMVFYGLSFAKRIFKSRVALIGVTAGAIIGAVTLIYTVNVFAYMSQISLVGQYENSVGAMTPGAFLEDRTDQMLKYQRNHPIIERAYREGGFLGTIIKIAYMSVRPINLHGIFEEADAPGGNKTRNLGHSDVQLFYLFQNASAIANAFIVPLVFIGLLFCLAHRDLVVFGVFYLVTLYFVSVFSGSPRHAMVYVVVSPLFFQYGRLSLRNAWARLFYCGTTVLYLLALGVINR